MKIRKIVIICALALFVLAGAIGITLAYLTDTDSVTNTFTVGDLQIELTEPNWSEGDGDSEVPGDTLVKDPTVLAEDNDCYIRFAVSFIDTGTGNVITDSDRADLIAQTMRFDSTYDTETAEPGTVITADQSYSLSELSGIPNVNPLCTLDESVSTSGTRYYNYENVLEEGETLTLFTNIVIPTDWGHDDMVLLGSYKIQVRAEAIQAANIDSADDAFSVLNDETSI